MRRQDAGNTRAGSAEVIEHALQRRDERREAVGSILWGPAIAFYPLRRPPVQLAARFGIGVGALDQAGGVGIDTGVTAHVHAVPGGGPMLWLDAGVQLLRHHVDHRWIDGRITQLTIGLAWAWERDQARRDASANSK